MTLHPKLRIADHPLVQDKLSRLRDLRSDKPTFRRLLQDVGALLGYEILRDLRLQETRIETPVTRLDAPLLEPNQIVLVAVLRAGSGLLDGLLGLVPDAAVGFVGLRRDEATLKPDTYYVNLPPTLESRHVICCDPMLATGGSAARAIELLKSAGARRITLACLLAAPEGVAHMASTHPDVTLWTAAVDQHLNAQGYIVPGLGDAGDRLYGT